MFANTSVKPVVSLAVVLAMAAVSWGEMGSPSIAPMPGNRRYATDMYPGFDTIDENVKPERKESHWWWFCWGGPKCGNSKDQYAYCQQLERNCAWSETASQLDALVRTWPTSVEAPSAQKALAEITLECLHDTEQAFKEYRYLLDFYSARCDYAAIADKLYEVAGRLRTEGKEVMFVRFENTVDVRRYYEMCVLRAPGAKWVAPAMLTIAKLREEEGKRPEAIRVYENLRNLYPDAPEAKIALIGEAEARAAELREHEYNRARCLDVINFLEMAARSCREEDRDRIGMLRSEAKVMMEGEAYLGAKFYDSPTRTRRSAIAAYERFLNEYPNSAHADEVRARIEVLKGGEAK